MTLVSLNGALVDEGVARIAPDDRGFTLGDGLFETMRVRHGRVFRLARHLDRLARSAQRLAIPIPPGIEASVNDIVRANGVVDGGVRLTLTRGSGAPGLRPPGRPRPTLLITAYPRPPAPDFAGFGVRAVVATGCLNERGAATGIKHTGYVESVLARLEAEAGGVEEAILLNTRGDLAEAAAANLFLVREGEMLTPDLASGALPGITRAAVLEIAEAVGLPAREQRLPRPALDRAEEAFLTSSLRGVVPLLSVDGREIGGGAAGEVTRRVAAEYRALVERETAGAGDGGG
jgi:branched-chain amino acid aminotransferase